MKRILQLLTLGLGAALGLSACATGPTDGNNEPADANAGPDLVVTDNDGNGFEIVVLDGSASADHDGRIEHWAWSISGQEIANGQRPAVAVPVGEATIELTVMDDDGATSADDVIVTVLPKGSGGQPIAKAGPDVTVTDSDGDGVQNVTLDGSGSSDPGPSRSLAAWTWTESGSPIASGTTPTVAFGVGTHNVTLTVQNDLGATASDDVVVTVLAAGGNQPPSASAGPNRTVTDADGNGFEVVSLDGSGSSDVDGTIASWVWREGGSQIAVGATPSVTLGVGAHDVTLTVTDDDGATGTDAVVITVQSPGGGNQPPVADAGPDQTVVDSDGNGSEVVSMDGSGTVDPDGSIAAAAWKENGQTIGNGQFPNLTLAVGVHTITLQVTDNGGATDTDDVIVTVQAPGGGNLPPVANAGPDQTVTDSDGSGAENVTLDGSGSSDPDGTITGRVWREGGAQIATGSGPTVPFTVGTHTVVLTVTDDAGATDTDTVVITVQAGGGGGGISYSGDIQPYLDAHCIACHNNNTQSGGVNLTSYNAVMASGIVVAGKPLNSRLYNELSRGHQGAPHGTTITQDVEAWIVAGAPDN